MRFTLLLILFLQAPWFSYSGGFDCTEKFLRNAFWHSVNVKTINVVVADDLAPMVSKAPYGLPIGFDYDLMNLISFICRVNFKYQFAPFRDLISIVQNNTNTISITSQLITPQRMELVSFAKFFRTGTTFLVRSTYTQVIKGLADLCGKRVVVQTGGTPAQDVQTQNGKCGSNPINIIIVNSYAQVEPSRLILDGQIPLFL
ncbi:unnamed protein product [Rotaria sp. Silwood2]|nr:unnamed protein product [Rotaria sp. Silwood2]